MAYRAVIFDLNGVFVVSPYLSDRFRDDFGVPHERFLPALKEIMAQVRLPGAGPLFTYWRPFFEKWGVDLDEGRFHDYWFDAEREVQEMLELARELKDGGLRVFVLSNNFRERAERYDRELDFLREIPEKVYYSWQTGFVKPDERAYRLIIDENGLEPEECFYFDDSKKNVEVASSLGIESYLFEGPEKTRQQLEELGVID